MDSRPIMTGLLAIGMTATAFQAAKAPNAAAGLNGVNAAVNDRASSGHLKPLPDTFSWSDAMEVNPKAFGRQSAAEEFTDALCDKSEPAEIPCPPPRTIAGRQAKAKPASAAVGKDTAAKTQKATPPATPDPRPLGVAFAIVPDPIHTHLALWFDRSIDALEDGLADGGWLYDRHWMPWSSEPASSSSNKFKDREQERLFHAGREEYPGVIVFHAPPPSERHGVSNSAIGPLNPDKPLLVFVIGDSPTSGINQMQFRQAVTQFKRIAPEQNTLAILGPNFTGSGPSLRALLSETKKDSLANVSVEIASGSISDADCKNLLTNGRPSQDKKRPGCTDHHDNPASPDRFISFDSDFAWEVQQTEAYLRDKGHLREDQIAELNEDESGFGGLATRHGASEGNTLKLTYPRNISHLRSAYQKNGVWGFGGTTNGASSVSLNLDFEEPAQADDSIASFAKRQFPVSQEAVLGQFSAILEQRGIKAVILSATDVLDELFVAQVLTRQNPNLAVIVRGTDVLFLRSGDGGIYHNMYAVSPWPLIPKDYFWSQSAAKFFLPAKAGEVRTFPNDHSQGYYTATRYLLPGNNPLNHLQDYRSPIPVAKNGTSSQRPPLWMLSIGRGVYWPFALLSDEPKKASSRQQESAVKRSPANLPEIPGLEEPVGLRPEEDSLPMTQRFLLLIACLLGLLHAAKCFELPLVMKIALRYRIVENGIREPKLWLRAGVSITGLILLALLYHPFRPFHSTAWFTSNSLRALLDHPLRVLYTHDWLSPLLLATAAVALALALAQTAMELVALKRALPLNPSRARISAVTVLILCVAGLLWRLFWQYVPTLALRPEEQAEGIREFFLYRSEFFFGGPSPVFPVLLAVAALTGLLLAHMSRLNFGPALAPRLPANNHDIPHCPTQHSVAELTNMLNYPVSDEIRRRKLRKLLLLALALLAAGFMGGLAPETFESRTATLLANTALFLLLLALLWELIMGHLLWRTLKDVCLEPLESSSLRHGFTSVCGVAWKDLWIMPDTHSSLAQYRTLLRALEQSDRGGLNSVAANATLRSDSATMFRRIRTGAPLDDIVQAFAFVQESLADTAEEVLLQLRDAWAQEQALITTGDASAPKTDLPKDAATKKEDAKPAPSAPHPSALASALRVLREEWVALLYIHYIRMVLMQIRSRLLAAAMLYLALVWTITSYPYINRHILVIGLSVVFVILTVIIVSTYASINRDAILSRTTENRPGKLDTDFYVKVASMVGIPLLGLVASQFPEISSFLFSWIQPGMAAVK